MDERVLTLVKTTLQLAAASCAIGVPLGTILAWLVARTNLPGRRYVATLLGLLLFVPLYLQAAAWQAGFGLEGWLAVQYGTAAWLDGFRGAAWVHGLAAVPWVALIVGVGLCLVEPELEEQALLDASPRRVFLRVTLPAVWPAVAAAALWVAITVAAEMIVTDLFAVRTYAEEVYVQFALAPEPGAATLGVLPGVAVSALLTAAGLWLTARLMTAGRPLSLRGRRQFALGAWRWPWAAVVLLGLALLVGVPLLNLVYKAGLEVTQVGPDRVRHWSATKCATLIAQAPWRHHRELGWSLVTAGLAAPVAVAVALPLTWFGRRGGRRLWPAMIVAAVALAVPGPIWGVMLIWLMNQPAAPWLCALYDRSIVAPALAMTIRALPIAILMLWHALRTVPPELLEAAALDGAGSLRRLLYVVLPLRRRAVLAALLAAFALAFGELSASMLVLPPGVTTIAMRVFELLHTGYEDRVSALCLALLAIFALLAAAILAVARKSDLAATADR